MQNVAHHKIIFIDIFLKVKSKYAGFSSMHRFKSENLMDFCFLISLSISVWNYTFRDFFFVQLDKQLETLP